MAKKRKKPPQRGPKGGKKHTPGRGHDRKSRLRKDRRRIEKARKRREALEAEARKQWAIWDSLGGEKQKLRPDLRPTLPRATDEPN
jgi:hypothetical protein